MKVRTGIDIIEIDRVKDSIENTEKKFCDKVYTKSEIEYCESKKMQKYQHYAARFAVKEAVFKAFSHEIEQITWKDIETLNDQDGRPFINLPDKYMKNIEDIDLSISHCKKYAIANVIVLFK